MIYYRQNDLELSPFTMIYFGFCTVFPTLVLAIFLTTIVEIPVFVLKKVFWQTESVTYFEHWSFLIIYLGFIACQTSNIQILIAKSYNILSMDNQSLQKEVFRKLEVIIRLSDMINREVSRKIIAKS